MRQGLMDKLCQDRKKRKRTAEKGKVHVKVLKSKMVSVEPCGTENEQVEI